MMTVTLTSAAAGLVRPGNGVFSRLVTSCCIMMQRRGINVDFALCLLRRPIGAPVEKLLLPDLPHLFSMWLRSEGGVACKGARYAEQTFRNALPFQSMLMLRSC